MEHEPVPVGVAVDSDLTGRGGVSMEHGFVVVPDVVALRVGKNDPAGIPVAPGAMLAIHAWTDHHRLAGHDGVAAGVYQ